MHYSSKVESVKENEEKKGKNNSLTHFSHSSKSRI